MAARLFDLTGTTVLVTGGSRGLGLALARGLAEHGADVALVARDDAVLQRAESELKRTGRRVWPFSFDLHDVAGIDALFGDVVRETGGIDILVNCAGITRRGPAEELDLAAWGEVMQINLSAVFAMSQAFCRHRKQVGRGGKIVNMGSLMCRGARPTTSAYAASKGGLLLLTQALAVEWAAYDITVNAVGPGYFATELTKALQEDPKLNAWVLSKTPLGRWGKPEDLIGAAVFLASSASDFVTGQIVYVDGGWLAGL